MSKCTVTSKGQITIPIEVRKKLGIHAGDELLFKIEKNDRISVYPLRNTPVHSLAGFLKQYAPKKPITVDEMKQAIRDRAVSRHLKK